MEYLISRSCLRCSQFSLLLCVMMGPRYCTGTALASKHFTLLLSHSSEFAHAAPILPQAVRGKVTFVLACEVHRVQLFVNKKLLQSTPRVMHFFRVIVHFFRDTGSKWCYHCLKLLKALKSLAHAPAFAISRPTTP